MMDVDIVLGALTAWRENRGGGVPGMQSVINVLCNRAKEHSTSIYSEATRPWQFSSMTAPGDPQLRLWPALSDERFTEALDLMMQASKGTLADITGGATFYYALSMTEPPKWAATMKPTVTIANQKFFKP
jgi:N-acetylmuramoyl-L-alanine amidase